MYLRVVGHCPVSVHFLDVVWPLGHLGLTWIAVVGSVLREERVIKLLFSLNLLLFVLVQGLCFSALYSPTAVRGISCEQR